MRTLTKEERKVAGHLLSLGKCPACESAVERNTTTGVYKCTSEPCGETFAYIYKEPTHNNRLTSESIPVFN